MRRSGPALGMLLAGVILFSLTLLTGTRVLGAGAATPAPTPTPPPQLGTISGDADCNGAVSAVDALQVLRFVAGLLSAQTPGCLPVGSGAAARSLADVNCDGDVTPVDALRILRYVAGMPDLPVEWGCPPIGAASATPTPTSTLGPPTFTPTPCTANCPTPTPVSTPPPTTQFTATNNTGVTANGLYLVLAAVPQGVILVPNVVSYPSACGPYGLSHQVSPEPQQISIDWTGGPCIAEGESVTLALLEFGCGTPCEPVSVICLHWTLDGIPIGTPCPTTAPTPTPTPTPTATPTPCAGCTPGPATPTPTFPPFTVFTATNDTGVAANDLHLVLAAPEGVSVLTQVLDDPPACGPVTSIDNSVLMDGTTIRWSGPPCIQHGESVVLQFLEVGCGTPCAPVTVECLHWTANGVPIDTPCPTTTPTPTPTPTPAPCAGCTPTPTPTPCVICSPTPTPTPTPAPQSPVNRFGIDTDPTGNTATTLGPIQGCASLGADSSLTIDVVVDSIQTQAGMSGGLVGFAFDLVYDPAKLRVTGVDNALFLASEPGSSLLDLSDPVPDASGNFTVIAIDAGAAPIESGSGVLSRITLLTLPGSSGPAHLGLQNIGLVDAANNQYWINLTTEADVAIGQGCPTPPVTIPPTFLPGTPAP